MAYAQTVQTVEARNWPPSPSTPLLPAIGPRLTFTREEEIFGEGERSEHIYQVLEGVVRTCRFSSDGRRQIEDFHLAGEYFGLEMGADHSCSAEAVGPVTVQLLKRSTLTELAARDLAVASQLLELTMNSLARTQKHVGVLSRKGASERVAAFLLDFADRSGAAAFVDLPMSRQEIGDYLGLTIETVSRTFTQLETERLISLTDRRRVVMRDREQLLHYCS
jgi:CRP/FNR family nitrogen fixation transcriptional regulator